ncbi:hypothetical protein Nans01_40040 [Nocardiopsis ansamitocini]|uniref:Uncharacterized protein n=1 Tax=Nocardiopsis ansamitocini TaxID=1670832 RepID=A0A9W6UKJ0_9ACTN|nr:hypothetical protein Nans01_40040 [Nocardiopsis ansamitocini]
MAGERAHLQDVSTEQSNAVVGPFPGRTKYLSFRPDLAEAVEFGEPVSHVSGQPVRGEFKATHEVHETHRNPRAPGENLRSPIRTGQAG